jgi:hypothetical protein
MNQIEEFMLNTYRIRMRVQGKDKDTFTLIRATTPGDAEMTVRKLYRIERIVKVEIAD